MQGSGVIERAFELAKSGNYKSISSIAACLRKEHYQNVDQHLSGAAVRKQLRNLIKNYHLEKEQIPEEEPGCLLGVICPS